MTENTCSDTACPVHYRNDYRETFEVGRETRLITYVGEFAVFTIDNPDLFTSQGAVEAIKAALGLSANPPRLFVTSVLRVGADGDLGGLADDPTLMDSMRVFSMVHGVMPDGEVALKAGSLEGIDKWVDSNLVNQHATIVEQVRDGVIPSDV